MRLNPFHAQHGAILPSTMEKNFSGFLVRKNAIFFKVDSNNLCAPITLLKEQLLIAKIIGPKPKPKGLEMWIQTLN